MKYTKIKKFRNKLLLSYSLIFVIPIILIGSFSYNKASYSLENEVKRNSSQVILQKSNEVDNIITELDRMALLTNSDEDVLDILRKQNVTDASEQIADYSKMEKIIEDIIGFRNEIVGFSIFTKDGRNFSMDGKSVKLGYDFTKDDWYSHLQTSNSYFIGSHYQKHIIDSYAQNVVSLSKVINDTITHKTIGYVLIDYNTQALDNIFQNSNNKDKRSTFIINDSKKLVYEPKNQYIGFDNIKEYINKLKNSEDVNTESLNVKGVNVLFSYYKSPYSNLEIIDVIPKSEIYKDIDNIGSYTIIIMLGSAIVAFILAFVISLGITEPVKKLREKMLQVEKGNLEVLADSFPSDEIGELGRQFEKMTTELNSMIKRVYKAELTRQAAEISALQAQINPHFIYNTLAVIDSMAVIDGNKDVSIMCRTLSKMLRYNVEAGKETTIEQELDQIKLYLYIQKMRYGERFEYSIQCDDILSKSRIIKLLIQPILENAITHGVEGKRGKVNIDIKVKMETEDSVCIIIEDSGSGMSSEKIQTLLQQLDCENEGYWKKEKEGKVHLGLKNVNYRIKLNYGKEFGVYVTSEINVGTTVKLVIPKQL
jgi:two-component system sensor histidine kinase YesM